MKVTPRNARSISRAHGVNGAVLGWSGGVSLMALALAMMITVSFAIVIPIQILLSNQLSTSL